MAARDDNGNGAKSAAALRRAGLWLSPVILATAIVVSYTINDRRDVESLRENYKRDISEIRDKLDSITRDLAERLVFVDRDGIRDPVVRMALDSHIAQMLQRMNVLTKSWADRLKDKNPSMVFPNKE